MIGERAEIFIKMILAENEETFCKFYNFLQNTNAKDHHRMWLQVNGIADLNGKPLQRMGRGLMNDEERKERRRLKEKEWKERNKEKVREYMRNYLKNYHKKIK